MLLPKRTIEQSLQVGTNMFGKKKVPVKKVPALPPEPPEPKPLKYEDVEFPRPHETTKLEMAYKVIEELYQKILSRAYIATTSHKNSQGRISYYVPLENKG